MKRFLINMFEVVKLVSRKINLNAYINDLIKAKI